MTAPLDLFLVLAGTAVLLSFRLDLNVFSLHEFYKNRLVRCFLGAVRCQERRPDCFTGFDADDDQLLINFNTRRGGNYYGPFPIFNATLNVSSGEELAWQERKSASFVMTPLYSGFNTEQGNEGMRLGEKRSPMNRPKKNVAKFGYRLTDGFCYPRGVHLGTAVAVSGAATSPNRGYTTSTATAFLMTVFDVRLGWYVGNPRRNDTYRRSSPKFNLLSLTQELFGLSDSRSGFVNLSDGGHFDNMGLYELVRRQCRFIIVCDAEQDSSFTFASFTQAIRNCRTDFGVEIRISLDRIRQKEKRSQTHCVVGTIEYPAAAPRPSSEDGQDISPDSKFRGYIVYLKSSVTGDESADVIGYQAAHPDFPHQSTAEQWFTESQFEAYRKLGQHIVQTALGPLRSNPCDRERYFQELQDTWYPPNERVDRLSSRHAERFADLTLDLADKDPLSFLDEQIFPGWRDSGNQGRWERAAMLRCTALIEFMETLYADLDLENPNEKDHPHNRGWLRIFDHWVQQPVFQETWRRTQTMYSQRFQAFYRDRVQASNKGKD